MKNSLRYFLLGCLMALPLTSLAAAGTVQYAVYGGKELIKQAGDAGYPADTPAGVITRGSFTITGTSTNYTSTVTYATKDGLQKCKFSANYTVNSTGPVYTSSVDVLIPGSNCAVSLAGQKYSAPYGFTIYASIY